MRRRSFLEFTAAALGGAMMRQSYAAPSRTPAAAKVLVVGGGFAGATCALTVRRSNAAIDVTLIDPDDRYVTCPMSNSALVGWRDLKSLSVSRQGLVQAGVRYVRDRVRVIDSQRRRVALAGGSNLSYDRLVMAPGIRFLWGKPQGYDEEAVSRMPHAWQAGAQTTLLAAQLRAIRDGGVVAISVPAGPMRCPPGPYERASVIAGYLKQNKPRCKVLIFDSNNHFPKQGLFTEAWQSLYPGMIEWISVLDDGAVERVAPETMTLFTAHHEHRVDVANIIPPQAPAMLAAEAGLASDHGWCPIKPESFESSLIADVHVIGDACLADPMPKSASAAGAQARQCALAIVASLDGHEAPPPQFDSVCYSLLARDLALSIHGRFRLGEGGIRQDPAPLDIDSAPSAQEVQNADAWYRAIVRDSFGS